MKRPGIEPDGLLGKLSLADWIFLRRGMTGPWLLLCKLLMSTDALRPGLAGGTGVVSVLCSVTSQRCCMPICLDSGFLCSESLAYGNEEPAASLRSWCQHKTLVLCMLVSVNCGTPPWHLQALFAWAAVPLQTAMSALVTANGSGTAASMLAMMLSVP